MNVVVIVLISVIIPVTAVTLHLVQESLERWDHRRHADD
jgi:hypothetical protein